MKKIFTLSFFALLSLKTFSQSATSVANGNWTMPTTWNCSCVPTPGYSVTINHNVTLNTSMSFPSGGLTVNSGGSLVQDASLNRDILISGGSFTNHGTANFRYLYTQTGSASNTGTINVAAFTNSVNYNNSGKIVLDSMLNTAVFTNTSTGILIGDSLTNTGTLTNGGTFSVKWVTNTNSFVNNKHVDGIAHTNKGTFMNTDSVLLSKGFWNIKNMVNQKYVKLGGGFYNYDPNTHTAVFTAMGTMDVLDSYYNTDTVKGGSAGYINVADTTANSGFMKGTFNFCDLSNTATSFPYLDLNSGSVSSGIIFCLSGIDQYGVNSFKIYPNPASSQFTISLPTGITQQFLVYNNLGEIMLKKNVSDNFSVNTSQWPDGIYTAKCGSVSRKVLVTH
ncbi:MAG: T9SS type A sorting domain-containing protein [Bacteroidia bacterium]